MIGDVREESSGPVEVVEVLLQKVGRDAAGDARDLDLGQCRPDGIRARCGAAGDHQHSAGPEPGKCLRHLADSAGPEAYVGRNAELELEHLDYQSPSSGEVLT